MFMKREPSYFGLLVLGMIFIVLGITLGDATKPVFIAIGVCF